MKTRFTPPYPKPQEKKLGLIKRFRYGADDWLRVLYKKSYNLKLGSAQVPKCKMFTVGDPVLVDELFRNKDNQFCKHEALNELLEPLVGQSVVNTNGKKWQQQRAMMNNAFTFTHLQRSFGIMSDAADDLIDSLMEIDSEFFVDGYMTHVVADIIIRTILSVRLDRDSSESMFASFLDYQKQAQKRFMLSLYRFPKWSYNSRAKQQAQAIRKFFDPFIFERQAKLQALSEEEKASYQPKDFLDAMLLARVPDTGESLNHEELVDQLSMFFVAGHETTSSLLTWAVYLLSQSPDWQQELYQELQALLSVEPLSVKNIKTLKQLQCFFNETLRIYPPIGFFMRRSKCPVHWRGKNISAKDILIISPWLIQRSDNHWKNPHEFDPDRFDLDNQEAQQRCTVHDQSHKQGFLPFGKGKRVCIGAGFATQETLIILAKLIQRFEILPTDHVPMPDSKVSTRSINGVKIKLKEREVL